MKEHADVVIVGGGVIGLTTAWFLAGRGARVIVLDQGEIGRQSSWAGAGIIPPGNVETARTPLDLLRAHSSRLFPSLSAELREQTGINNGYLRCGGVELPDPDAPGQSLPSEEWHAEGVPCESLDRVALHRLVPDLAPDLDHGALIPDMAQVRNPRHLQALQRGCASRGVVLHPNWIVRNLILEGTRVVAVEGDRGRFAAGQVLVAAGAWSDALLAQAGWTPGVRPVRGQIALLNTGNAGLRPILLQGNRYLVPRPDGRVLAGSTEEDAGFDARPTAGGIAGLLELAVRLVPSLAGAQLEHSWAGLRPGSPDGLPFLGRVPGKDNLHVATGHFRAGLQLSAATGLAMAQHLLGEASPVPLEVFRLDRPTAHAETAFRRQG